MSEQVKLYSERDIIQLDEQGGCYSRHVLAMTREALHSKSDIAAELGFRDWQIATLQAECERLRAELAAIKAQEQ